MRPKKHETTGSGDLFRARLEQIINMKHDLVQLAEKSGRPFGYSGSCGAGVRGLSLSIKMRIPRKPFRS